MEYSTDTHYVEYSIVGHIAWLWNISPWNINDCTNYAYVEYEILVPIGIFHTSVFFATVEYSMVV